MLHNRKNMMSPEVLIGLVCIGLFAGFASSMIGIGGGIIIVPALVFLLGFDQKMAQGTSLFLLSLPVAALGAFTYYKAGNVSPKAAIFLGIGFLVGGYLGGTLANKIDAYVVKKIFAIFMILVAFKYLFFDKKPQPKINTKTESQSAQS